MEPLREDWRDVQTAVQRLAADGKDEDARKLVRGFHAKLCEIRVLDPACGSGNFLYVALEMMKRLEGEVTSLLDELGETQSSFITVDPHQFLGIELNSWAANVAELVLWIGYLQWHYRTHGQAAPSEPVLRDFKNIRNGDAVLEWSGRTPRMDEHGAPVTRWDGITTIRHNVTGEEVPDPAARIAVYDYAKPKATKWPEAEFIVGNPPFIGASRLRDSLGDGYVEALWSAHPKMPQSADLVMFWWEKAALAARAWNAKTGKGTRRFGLITTNSLRQAFNRRVLEPHLSAPKKPLSLLFGIPDHPWVDTQMGAAVRIAMTVGAAGNRSGRLLAVATERNEKNEADGRSVTFNHQIGKILGNLRIGADILSAKTLQANVASSSCGTSQKSVRGGMTKPKQSGAFSGHRFPPEIIAYAVWAYHRFPMSLRDVEDLLAARGVVVSYETIRAWVAKFGLQYAKAIRRDRPEVADKWHLDEVVLPINGKKYWLWRAVDSKGDVLDILVQSRRNKRAAIRFFRKLFKAFGVPRVIVTDKLRSYGAALKELAPGIEHRSHKGLNNRSEGSHRPTRRREKIMGRFKSPRQAQRFLSVHDQVQTIFRPRRHTLSAAAYRQTRADAHWIWDDIR